MNPRNWNPSETLFAFLQYAFDGKDRMTLSFDEYVQLMQDFSSKHKLPPTRDGWQEEMQ